MKLEIIEKAYAVWVPEMIGYTPDHCAPDWSVLRPVYANSRSEAKSGGFSNEWDWDSKDDLEWINIKCRRLPKYDIVEYDGEKITVSEMDEMVTKKKLIQDNKDSINKYPDNEMFYVYNGYVGNCIYFYAPSTTHLSEAKKYNKQDALRYANGLNGKNWIPASIAEKAATLQVDMQNIRD